MMINLDNIKKYYPSNLHPLERFILREYLQYKILESISKNKLSNKLVFIGGTALRIIYDNQRFSEDLEFDNYNLTPDEFSILCNNIANDLRLEGIESEQRLITKGSYRCYLKFSSILQELKLSGHKQEKFLIQIDTMTKEYKYTVETPTINKFDVTTKVNCAPISVLLSKKIEAIFGRKSPKGRDYYDFIWATALTNPDYNYLKNSLAIENIDELKFKLLEFTKDLDFNQLAKDVQPFLFNSESKSKVLLFRDIVKNL